MFKKMALSACLLCASSAALSCDDMPSDEKLVCEVILCNPLGLLLAESRDRCEQININFAKYLARLGFLKKPPKCRMRNSSCQETGVAQEAPSISASFCDGMTGDDRIACLVNSGNGHTIPEEEMPPEICENSDLCEQY